MIRKLLGLGAGKPDESAVQRRILFCCMGNICRSPSAEAVARHLLRQRGLDAVVAVASAGTHAFHVGASPDPRSAAAAKARGVDMGRIRARRVSEADFVVFDHVLAMDQDNLKSLEKICPPEHRNKLALLMRYASRHAVDEVPDPYYGGPAGFERVLDLLEDGVGGLLDTLQRELSGSLR